MWEGDRKERLAISFHPVDKDRKAFKQSREIIDGELVMVRIGLHVVQQYNVTIQCNILNQRIRFLDNTSKLISILFLLECLQQ